MVPIISLCKLLVSERVICGLICLLLSWKFYAMDVSLDLDGRKIFNSRGRDYGKQDFPKYLWFGRVSLMSGWTQWQDPRF